MTTKYKLTYFDITGLGEPLRFLLSYGELEFEDNRISNEEWPAFKETTPLGQMPLLEVDGNILYHNTAIARYLGHVVGLAGENALENWEIDSVVDAVTELRIKILLYYFEQNEEKKDADHETFVRLTVPFYLGKFEEWAEQNGGYLALKRLTWADLYFVAILEFLSLFTEDSMDLISNSYPNLQAVKNNVLSLPQIRAWLEKRPALKL